MKHDTMSSEHRLSKVLLIAELVLLITLIIAPTPLGKIKSIIIIGESRPISNKTGNSSTSISSYTIIKNDSKWDQITGNGSISFTFRLNSYTYDDGVYSFNYCIFTTREGFPILPYVSERFILPYNASIKDVSITEVESEILRPPSLRVFVSGPKNSSGGSFDLFSARTSAYNFTFDVFPEKIVQVGGSHNAEYGVDIYHLSIFPFQAYRNGSVILHKKMKITIKFSALFENIKIHSDSKFLEDSKTAIWRIFNSTNIPRGLRRSSEQVKGVNDRIASFIFVDEESFFPAAVAFSTYFHNVSYVQHFGLIMLRPNETKFIPQTSEKLEVIGYMTPSMLNYTSLLHLISAEWSFSPGIIVADTGSSPYCAPLASYLNWPLLIYSEKYNKDVLNVVFKFIRDYGTTNIFTVGNVNLMINDTKVKIIHFNVDEIPNVLAGLQWNEGYLATRKSQMRNYLLHSMINPEDYNFFANQNPSKSEKSVYYLVLYSSSSDDNFLPAAQMLASYRGAILLNVAGYNEWTIRSLLNYYNPYYVALYGDGDPGEVTTFLVPDPTGDDPNIATDFYYAERDECHPPDTWSNSPITIDSFVGRPIAASDLATQEYINVIYLYENGGLSSYYFIGFAALFSYEFGWGDASQDVYNLLSSSGATYLRWYKRSNNDFTKNNVLRELDNGLQIAYFNTHGATTVITTGDNSGIFSSDLAGHDFKNHPTYLHVDACRTTNCLGRIEYDELCIAANFMDHHILGYLGSTGISYVGYFDTFDRNFFKYIRDYSALPLGMIVALALEDSYYQFGPGDFWGLSARDKKTILEILLLADPAVTLYFGNDGAPSDKIPPTNPTTFKSYPQPNTWSNVSTVYVQWSGASDYGTGINGYWYRWTLNAPGDPTGYSYTTSTSITSSPLSTGIWYFNIRSRDNAGNNAQDYVYYGPFKIDTTPPGAPSLSGPSGWTNDNTPRITWSAVSDIGSGVAGYEYAIDQTTSWTNLGNVLGFDTPPLSDGSHVIYVRAYDGAGNRGSYGSWTVKIDTTPPVGSITINGGASYTNSPSVTLAISASDGRGSGVAYMCFSNDGYSWSSWEPYATSKQWTLTPGDGVKTVYVKFKDYVGLESSPVSASITLDTTPPSTPTLSSPTNGSRVNPRPTFVWTASSDSTSGVSSYILEIDTSPTFDSSNLKRYEVATTSYQIPQNLSLGTWYWRVRARDKAGNLGSFSIVYKIVVDRLKIIDGGVSNSRIDVGAPVTVWFKAVYESDNLIFDDSKGTLYINGKAAQWSSLNNRWELTDTQTTVQKKSYTVTGLSDIYGLTTINNVVGSLEVIWDRIKITGYAVSDDRANVNSTQFVFVNAVYEYDNVPFTTGVLKINDTDAYYNASIKKWVLPYSSSKVGKIVFKVSSVKDSMYNLTFFYDSNLPPSIIWDRVKIDSYGAVSERVSVNSSCLIYFVLKYEYDDSLVTDGVVILNGSLPMTWNYTSNRWELKDSLSSVGKKTYYISSIKNNKYNITVLEQGAPAKSVYVIWDRIKITSYEVSKKRADVGSNQKVFVSAVYEYDNKPFVDGQLYVNGSLATYNSSINKWVVEVNSSQIGRFIYKVSRARSGDLSLVYDNLTPPSIIWDRIKIYDGGVNSALVNTGEKQVIWFKAVYEYDGVPFNESAGSLYVNGTKAVWNSTYGRWEITYVSDVPKALVFSISSIDDAIYGLTAFISEVKPKVVWTELWMTNLTMAPSFLVNVNTTVSVSVQVVWAHNGSVVPGATVNFSLGRQAWVAKTNSSGWASFNVSQGVIGSYRFNLTALEDPSRTITKCRGKTGEVTWTALKLINASYDKPITNVGSPIRIQLRVVWAHNNSASVGALVGVNGTLFTATTNETGWVSFNITYNKIGIHCFEIKPIKDHSGYVTTSIGSYSPQLTWTGLNVTDFTFSKDFLSIGENATFYVKLVWAHNGSTVIGGLVNVSGSIGITNSSGWAVVNVTKLIGGVYEVKAIPLRDSMGWVTMPLKIVSHNVTWTGLRILNVLWEPSNVINIGENITIYAQLVYAHNNSPIAMGIVAFNNTQLETNETGWASYKLSYSRPISITVSIWGIKDAVGVIRAHEEPKNCTLTWTALVLNLITDKSLANTGENVTLYASLRWVHNSSAIKAGIISLNGIEKETNETGWASWIFSYDDPNTYLFRAVAVRDPTGYVTVGMPGNINITVTWTELRISSYTISKYFANINESITITGTLIWAHNGSPVIGGLISLGNSISYTNKSGVAIFNISQDKPGEYKYIMNPVRDSTGHITKGKSVQLPSITWTALKIDQMTWDKDFVNIGEVVRIYAHLAYAHNLTSIAGGIIAFNGTIAVTNSTGWAIFNVSVNSPSSYVYFAKGVRDGTGIVTVAANNESHKFTWTAINISYIASNATLSEVNKTVEITAKVVWAHNGSAIPGALVTLAGNSTMLQAYTNGSGYARFNITVSKVGEYFFNLTGKEAYGINKTLGSKSTSIRFGIKCYITLQLRKGYNLIALPLLNDSLTASSLLSLIGEVSQSVFMFNASSQAWVSYDKKLVEFGIPQPNFKIEPNVGYFVYVSNDTNVTFVGIRNDFKRIIPLRKGYNLIGWTSLNRSTVIEKFINYSSSIDSVFMFNETIQRYVSYDKKVAEFGVEQPNFEILPGHAYFVYANKDDYLYYGGEV